MAKKYILLCQSCSWKIVSDLSDSGLHELKNDSMSSRKFRCPNCGRAVVPRGVSDPQKEQDRKAESERLKEENKKWMEENIRFQNNFVKEKDDNEN
jgi:predicted RNA-binding Zn-ribbon protein involved in translation (DUF1610 family)